uniref:Glutathione transferase n=1 Tax=Globodera rostochiensis TaxID=31243 RepID=A0A914H1N1_GLORO
MTLEDDCLVSSGIFGPNSLIKAPLLAKSRIKSQKTFSHNYLHSQMSAQQLKLYYFTGVRGRAEYIRQILKLANVPYEEVSITFDTWSKYKGEMPLGQVPVLEVDGVKLGQSLAIARYLGERYGLSPKEPLARALLEMIADHISDAQNSGAFKDWPLICLELQPCEDKAAFFREKIRPLLDACANLVENYLVESENGTLLGKDKITWADIYAAEFFSKCVDFGEKDCLEAFPHIKALIDRIHNEPVIKKHIAARGETKF